MLINLGKKIPYLGAKVILDQEEHTLTFNFQEGWWSKCTRWWERNRPW